MRRKPEKLFVLPLILFYLSPFLHAPIQSDLVKEDVRNEIQVERKKVMKLYVKSTREIEIYSSSGAEACLITKFNRKDWGTWNIKGWYIANEPYSSIETPYAGCSLLAGENTDWEYVLRVDDPETKFSYFSGGNHGNEELESIEFIDTFDGKAIELVPGTVKETGKLAVIERTALNSDELNIRNYANVEREYMFEPDKINLTTKYTFNRDIYLGTCYVAMFPVFKDYGRYCRFEGSGTVFESPKQGFTETTEGHENYIGKVGATSAELWGDRNPDFRFRVWITGSEMADGFQNDLKVFLWDVNKFGNKLYFSKYENDEPVEIKAGTVWDNEQGWEFIHQ